MYECYTNTVTNQKIKLRLSTVIKEKCMYVCISLMCVNAVLGSFFCCCGPILIRWGSHLSRGGLNQSGGMCQQGAESPLSLTTACGNTCKPAILSTCTDDHSFMRLQERTCTPSSIKYFMSAPAQHQSNLKTAYIITLRNKKKKTNRYKVSVFAAFP